MPVWTPPTPINIDDLQSQDSWAPGQPIVITIGGDDEEEETPEDEEAEEPTEEEAAPEEEETEDSTCEANSDKLLRARRLLQKRDGEPSGGEPMKDGEKFQAYIQVFEQVLSDPEYLQDVAN